MRFRTAVLLLLLIFSRVTTAKGGRGGAFFDFHANSLSAFDSALKGNPTAVGGMGFGYVAKRFRLGGAGGGAFLIGGSSNAQFGLGYGGVVGEYQIASWLNARLLIGGGGFSVQKIISETPSQITVEKVGGGAFFLFQPSLVAEIPIARSLLLTGNLGYFLPNASNLSSFTLGLSLIFSAT